MQERIRSRLLEIVAELAPEHTATVVVERTKRPEHGDFTSNVALALAGRLARRPRELAEALAARLKGDDLVDSVEIAGPGFLNFRVARSAWWRALCDVIAQERDWGRGHPLEGPRILVEHPSPNPTGPLTVASARIAALGDSLARVLSFAGYPTTTECYINDYGSKIRLFAESIAARARNEDPPPSGYRGTYVKAVATAAQSAGVSFNDLESVGRFGVSSMLEEIRQALTRFRALPEAFIHERDLYEHGMVRDTLDKLRQDGRLEERDGAVWFRSTELGEDDKNRVVVRSTGEPTYFAADIAYHRDKFARDHQILVNILGPDHHGYVERMRSAVRALGHSPDSFQVLMVQLVTLLRGGQKVAMDKSAGEFVTLSEVLDEVGADAARFFFLMRRHDSPLDFDLELAKKRSLDNPVYYVQYAHARCASIAQRAQELGFAHPPATPALFECLTLPDELDVTRKLVDLPQTVREAADAREPHRIVYYAMELAQAFQSYYTRLQKVHSDPILPQQRHRAAADWQTQWDVRKTGARLCWVRAIKSVLATSLQLVGVSAPERMERAPEGSEEEA